MASNVVEQHFKKIVDGVAIALKPARFVKRRMAFRHSVGGNTAIIEFQRSQPSSRDSIRFTLNAGVISGRLLEDWRPDASKAGSVDAQLRRRLGGFLPGAQDKWWTVEASTDPEMIVGEIAGVLTKSVAPFLLDYISDEALKSLWESGQSPGLTEGQRLRYLAELEAAEGKAPISA